MGQSLSAVGTGTPLYGLRMVLTCDGEHGLAPSPPATWNGQDYIVMRAGATLAGWRRCFGGVWLGPCCAKIKIPMAIDD